MSVAKLLSRVVSHDSIDYKDMKYKAESNTDLLYDNSFGIASDPLAQFAVVFSALIHDLDHAGVPNSQLVEEQTEVSEDILDLSAIVEA